jgi:hypothetical protein
MDTSNSLFNIVSDIVEDMFDDLQSFTSIDVSNAVKALGHTYRHREVSQVLREEVLNRDFIRTNGYLKTRITVQLSNGQSAAAFLYHHETVSPDDYTQRSQVPVRPVGNVNQQDDVTVRRSISDLSDTNSGTVGADQEDAVEENIPVVVSPCRRSLSEAVAPRRRHPEPEPLRPEPGVRAGVRRSIFDVANRSKAQKSILETHGSEDTEKTPIAHDVVFLGDRGLVFTPESGVFRDDAKVRKSIFDVASRAQTLVCRNGPKTQKVDNDNTRSYRLGHSDGLALNNIKFQNDREYILGYFAGVSEVMAELDVATKVKKEVEVNPNLLEVQNTHDVGESENLTIELADSDINTISFKDSVIRGLTSDYRLEIPPAWLVTLGWLPGAKIHAYEYIISAYEYGIEEDAMLLSCLKMVIMGRMGEFLNWV